jgi:hypothetical protein
LGTKDKKQKTKQAALVLDYFFFALPLKKK